MNSKILGLLEFNKILDLLAEQAGSEITKERISGLRPMTNVRMVQDALTETTEAVSVIIYKGNIPIGEIGDISGIAGRTVEGSHRMAVPAQGITQRRPDKAGRSGHQDTHVSTPPCKAARMRSPALRYKP